MWIYAILFAIIFCETGFVVTPFLPGDSLLFVAGAIAAAGELNVHLLFALLALAAFLGNSRTTPSGAGWGKRFFTDRGSRWLNPEAPRQGARVLRAPRRQGGGDLALPADRPHLRAVRGRHGARWTRASSRSTTRWARRSGSAALAYAGYFFGNIPWISRQSHRDHHRHRRGEPAAARVGAIDEAARQAIGMGIDRSRFAHRAHHALDPARDRAGVPAHRDRHDHQCARSAASRAPSTGAARSRTTPARADGRGDDARRASSASWASSRGAS